MKAIVLVQTHEKDYNRIEWEEKNYSHFELTGRAEKVVNLVARAMGGGILGKGISLALFPGSILTFCDSGNERSGDSRLLAQLFSERHLAEEFAFPSRRIDRMEEFQGILNAMKAAEFQRNQMVQRGKIEDSLVVFFSPHSTLLMSFLEAFGLLAGPLLGFMPLDWRKNQREMSEAHQSGLLIDFVEKRYIEIPAPAEEQHLDGLDPVDQIDLLGGAAMEIVLPADKTEPKK